MVLIGENYWDRLDAWVMQGTIIVDRPRGSAHPRYPELIYPFDYGYLQESKSMDGGGIDVWLGSLGTRRVCGVISTLDTLKRDAEIKILVGCTWEDAEIIFQTHNSENQTGILIWREE